MLKNVRQNHGNMGGTKRETPRVLGTSPTVGSVQRRKEIIWLETKKENKNKKTVQAFLFFFLNWSIVICNAVLVSALQPSELVICAQVSTLFQIIFPYTSLQSTEQSSLCYTVGSYQLSSHFCHLISFQLHLCNRFPPLR